MATQPSGNSVPCEATLSLDSGYGFSVCFFVLVGKKKNCGFQLLFHALSTKQESILYTCS